MNTATSRVEVYYNLHKGCLSVRDKKTRRVSLHCKNLLLKDVRFKVSQAGIKRVRELKRKSVIAVVEGTPVAWQNETSCESQVYFNPYKVNQFMLDDNPIFNASYCFINGKIILV